MPKERFHLLMADECFHFLKQSRPQAMYTEKIRQAFLLGAIMPDTLYYDLPYFAFSPVGRRLHRLEVDRELVFFRAWLEEEGESLPRDVQFWILGLAVHYLADGYWHPIIKRYSLPHSWLCRRMRLSARHCHYWMESQLEAYWLPSLSPPDGYCETLKRIQSRRGDFERYFRSYRVFLSRAGVSRLPKIARIGRCLYWQTASLRTFAHPRCGALWKSRLLDTRDLGKSLGSLIVPPRPAAPFVEACRMQDEQGLKDPCDGRLLAGAISLLSDRLLTLPVQF
jgi:hypothetical protein